ncbi:hypothetical protein ACFQH6_20620 [Halobacteriaceae archaeon GCM10025711]
MSPHSFSDPDTHYRVIRSDTPIDVDGFNLGEPTGEIQCEECGAEHLNVDEIPHEPWCSQRYVKSLFWQHHYAVDD